MGRVYKNYTKDLKEQACKLVVEKNIPVRIVAEKLSVRVQLLYKLLKQYESFCRFRTSKKCRCATEETAKGKRVLKTGE